MYTRGQLADICGVSIKAMRVYEDKKLITPVSFTKVGYRLYDESSVERLKRIRLYIRYKIPLNGIVDLLNSPEQFVKERLLEQRKKLSRESSHLGYIASELREGYQIGENHSAIIVANIQNDFVHGPLSKPGTNHLSLRIAQFLDEIRKYGLPIIFLLDEHFADEEYEFRLWGKHAVCGSQGADLCEEVKVSSRDHHIKKQSYSGFFETGLLSLLHSINVNHLIFTGFYGNVCIRSTVHDAFNYRFKTTLLTDLTCSSNKKCAYDDSFELMKSIYNTELIDSASMNNKTSPAQPAMTPHQTVYIPAPDD